MSVLQGVRVLDFSQAMAGPACGMLLADFGAEVIKIEPPKGESSRSWGTARAGENDQFSGLYIALNRNKASITLDLKSEKGQEIISELIKTSDIILENFRPGVADRLGIGYEDTKKLKEDIIYCSISGFGQTGPNRNLPGFDMLLQAYAGHMSITGEPDRPSVRTGPSPIDLLTGAHASYALALALIERQKSGRGQYIDLSLYDTALHLVGHYIADYTAGGALPAKHGPFFAFLAPYGIFKAKDREFYLGVDSRSYANFCNEIGCPHLIDDERFTTNAERLRNRDALHEILVPLFAEHDAAYWTDLCTRLGIPTSLVNDITEVLTQDQAQARDMIINSGIDQTQSAGIPIKMSVSTGTIHRPPPKLGEDTERILAELNIAEKLI